jgi:1-acyl-sn-glycerol-3-phosphate acyltransferase
MTPAADGQAAARPPRPPKEDPIRLRSPRMVGFFERVFARFFGRHMRALRIPPWGLPQVPPGAPLVVLANHPSWWDGVAFMMLSRLLFRDRPVFIPMEAAALARYPFMKRLGVFGVEPGTTAGGVAFLRNARHILGSGPGAMLWMNAPGRFCDVRERPVPIAPGVARLPELAPDAVFLPLALDYVFWTERAPEMLAAFGPPMRGEDLLALDRSARATHIATVLAGTMDRLAEEAILRDPARFTTIAQGQEGMGGFYQGWRRLRAMLRGERFDPRHDPSKGAA